MFLSSWSQLQTNQKTPIQIHDEYNHSYSGSWANVLSKYWSLLCQYTIDTFVTTFIHSGRYSTYWLVSTHVYTYVYSLYIYVCMYINKKKYQQPFFTHTIYIEIHFECIHKNLVNSIRHDSKTYCCCFFLSSDVRWSYRTKKKRYVLPSFRSYNAAQIVLRNLYVYRLYLFISDTNDTFFFCLILKYT